MTDDAELVALIANELDQSSIRDALLTRLATDEQLRGRYDELRKRAAESGPIF